MAMNTGGASFKTGIVAQAKAGYARVKFEDLDGMVSDWLPVVMRKTLNDKACHTLDIGEHVACVLDEYFDHGVVLGAIYSNVDNPPVSSPDKLYFSFFDGGSFEYDRSTGHLAIVTTGSVDLVAGGAVSVRSPSRITLDTPEVLCTGVLHVATDITAGGSIMDAAGNSNHHSH